MKTTQIKELDNQTIPLYANQYMTVELSDKCNLVFTIDYTQRWSQDFDILVTELRESATLLLVQLSWYGYTLQSEKNSSDELRITLANKYHEVRFVEDDIKIITDNSIAKIKVNVKVKLIEITTSDVLEMLEVIENKTAEFTVVNNSNLHSLLNACAADSCQEKRAVVAENEIAQKLQVEQDANVLSCFKKIINQLETPPKYYDEKIRKVYSTLYECTREHVIVTGRNGLAVACGYNKLGCDSQVTVYSEGDLPANFVKISNKPPKITKRVGNVAFPLNESVCLIDMILFEDDDSVIVDFFSYVDQVYIDNFINDLERLGSKTEVLAKLNLLEII